MMLIGILAQAADSRTDRLRVMHEHFKEPDPQVPLNILIAVLAVLAVFVIIRLLNNLQNRQLDEAKIRPMSLYLRVQAQLGLTLLERWRLWRLARMAGLANPTALLLSPVLFDRAVQGYVGSRPGSSRASSLATIRVRLFGQTAPQSMESALPGE